MKNFLNFKSFLGLAVAALLLSSCAQSDKVVTNNLIQKRKYNKGFYTSLKKNKKENLAVIENTTTKKQVVSKEVTTPEVSTPVFAVKSDDVSSVVLKSNNEKKSTQIDKKEVKVENNIIASKRVEKIIKKVNKAIVKENNKMKKNASPNAPAKAGGKSQVVALILCALVGGIGIHRFYLGYTWQGVVQLLTLGACGIWSLIDLIRIITGDLGPKDGRYDKTL